MYIMTQGHTIHTHYIWHTLTWVVRLKISLSHVPFSLASFPKPSETVGSQWAWRCSSMLRQQLNIEICLYFRAAYVGAGCLTAMSGLFTWKGLPQLVMSCGYYKTGSRELIFASFSSEYSWRSQYQYKPKLRIWSGVNKYFGHILTKAASLISDLQQNWSKVLDSIIFLSWYTPSWYKQHSSGTWKCFDIWLWVLPCLRIQYRILQYEDRKTGMQSSSSWSDGTSDCSQYTGVSPAHATGLLIHPEEVKPHEQFYGILLLTLPVIMGPLLRCSPGASLGEWPRTLIPV